MVNASATEEGGALVRNSAMLAALTIGVMTSLLVARPTKAASDDLLLNIPAKQRVAGQSAEESSVKAETNPQKSMLASDSSPCSSTNACKLQLADAATTVESGMTA